MAPRRDPVLLALLVIATIYLFWDASRPFAQADEFWYGEIVANMLATGDVITPRLGERPDFTKPPLFFLGAGSQSPPDPVQLLASDRMRSVLERLRRNYSHIVIDAPPLLAVSDPVALSTLVDGVVLVLSERTPKPAALKARARLDYARARVLGAVLNQFDLRMAGEDYGGTYYQQS